MKSPIKSWFNWIPCLLRSTGTCTNVLGAKRILLFFERDKLEKEHEEISARFDLMTARYETALEAYNETKAQILFTKRDSSVVSVSVGNNETVSSNFTIEATP